MKQQDYITDAQYKSYVTIRKLITKSSTCFLQKMIERRCLFISLHNGSQKGIVVYEYVINVP